MTVRKKTRSHEEALMEELQDPELVANYLTAAIEENDLKTFLLVLRDIAKAQGVSKISKHTKINRQHIYRALSKNGNPTLNNMMNILSALDFEFQVIAKKKAA